MKEDQKNNSIRWRRPSCFDSVLEYDMEAPGHAEFLNWDVSITSTAPPQSSIGRIIERLSDLLTLWKTR
jgi:hypothetical protein